MLRGLRVWLVIMTLETVHGVLRGLFLVPWVGEAAASRIGWPIGLLIVMAVTFSLIGRTSLRDRGQLLRLGALWALLTLVFEIAIGLLRGLDAPRIWSEINPLAGGLMLYSVIVMALAPYAASRLRSSSRSQIE